MKEITSFEDIAAAQREMQRNLDPFGIFDSLVTAQNAWLKAPKNLSDEMRELLQGGYDLWFQSFQRFSGLWSEDVIPPAEYDERFQDDAWKDNPYFDMC